MIRYRARVVAVGVSMRCAAVAILLLLCELASNVPQAGAQTPAQLAAAREALEAMHLGPTMVAGATSMIEIQVQQNPVLAPYREVMLEWAGKYLTAEAALPEMAMVYANTFTEGELRELAKFYRTPTGQKLVANQPELTRQGAAVGQKIAVAHQAELEAMIRAKAGELGQTSPGQAK